MVRSRLINWLVLISCGPVVGITCSSPTLPSGEVITGLTSTIPGVVASALATFCSAVLSAGVLSAAITCNGPLVPGPNPCASKS